MSTIESFGFPEWATGQLVNERTAVMSLHSSQGAILVPVKYWIMACLATLKRQKQINRPNSKYECGYKCNLYNLHLYTRLNFSRKDTLWTCMQINICAN